jgi:hypothetical protein
MSTDTFNPIDDLGVDPRIEELISLAKGDKGERVAIIRTSDRIQYRNCRRRWGWQSHLRGNLTSKENAGPLWFGSGIHFALEDFHSINRYGHPARSFEAYVLATKKNVRVIPLPADWDDLRVLGHGMMFYYGDYWLRNRRPLLRTFIFRGQPQVEVNAHIEIPRHQLPKHVQENFDRVIYSITLDRVIEDDDNLLWIVEYKTAKRLEVRHLPTDPQVNAYCWAGQMLYGRPISGVIYQQHLKRVPEPPRMLADGTISINKSQVTTHALYRAQVARLCGSDSSRWPSKYVEMVNYLAQQESPVHDDFIRRDRVYRNEHSAQAEGQKILFELDEMLNSDTALYPNAHRFQCGWCPFLNACISIDDGGDWEFELQHFFQSRPTAGDSWRRSLPNPQALQELQPPRELQLLS